MVVLLSNIRIQSVQNRTTLKAVCQCRFLCLTHQKQFAILEKAGTNLSRYEFDQILCLNRYKPYFV